MRCVDHEKLEGVSYDGENVRVDSGTMLLFRALTDHRMIVRAICQGHVLFADQTHYEARQHRAEVRLVHDEVSLAFVRGLMLDSHFFEADKVLWDIQFDWVPFGERKGERRVTLSFPPQDIQGLIDYISMKDTLARFHAGELAL